MGAFGIKIPTEYGGLGLSYTSYVKAMAMVTSKDGSLTALLSAHQSIGLPQPLKLFGTDGAEEEVLPAPREGRDLARSRSPKSTPAPIRRTCARTRDADATTASTSSSTARSSGAPTARAPSCSS